MRVTPVILLVLAACNAPQARHGHDGVYVFEAPRFAHGESVRLTHERPFARVGVRYDSHDSTARVLVRAPVGEWQEAHVVYAEGLAHNALVDLPAEVSAVDVELRGDFEFVTVELVDQVGSAAPLAAVEPSVHGLATVDAMVHAQSDWSQIDVNCGEAHTPKIFTIHHTDSPNDDQLSPQERLRQIQAYHREVRGWCDIGYHFLVSRDGELWRGRKSETRTGAHVADHNSTNVGIAFLGSFMEARVPDAMVSKVGQLLQVLSDGYAVPLVQEKLLGHRQWPSASTDCPGDQLLARFPELLDGALDGDGDGAPASEDCDDTDRNNWASCASCADHDGDDFFSGCDDYKSIEGPDCEDGNPAVNPAAMETVGDGVDQNCNGSDGDTCYVDGDHDGYGSKVAAPNQTDCAAAGFSSVDTDCDDSNASIKPRALEFCDEVDTDCDGSKVDRFSDGDKDGLPDCVDAVFDLPPGPDETQKRTKEEGCAATGVSGWLVLAALALLVRRRG